MPGAAFESVVPDPALVPVPPVPVHQFTVALVPDIPLAVSVVVALLHIGLASAVAEVIPTFVLAATVTIASAGVPQSPVTLAKYVPGGVLGSETPVPALVPVPPVPVHQLTTAFVPDTPLAVSVVAALLHIGLLAAVAVPMATSVFVVTITTASAAAAPQSLVTHA